MAEKERRRPSRTDEKTKVDTSTPERVIGTKPVKPFETPITFETETGIVKPKPVFLPSWGSEEDAPWMYFVPDRKEDVEQWAKEWGDFILKWGAETLNHYISLSIFVEEEPFKWIAERVKALRIIGDYLVKSEVAEWTDKRKTRLKIIWRTIEEWCDLLYEWALEKGRMEIDLKSIYIQEADTPFASLPEEDLKQVIEQMVKSGYATWIDKKMYAIKLEI